MNYMEHPRGGFSRSHVYVPRHVETYLVTWIDEYIYHYRANGERVIIALKKWRKKKGIRR
jgi:hypothetical protein